MIRTALVNFSTPLAGNTALLLVYICNGNSVYHSIHRISTTNILILSFFPALLRLIENLYIFIHFGPVFSYGETSLWSSPLVTMIDFSVCGYFIIQVGVLITFTLRLQVKQSRLIKSALHLGHLGRDAHKLSRWVMSSRLAWTLLSCLVLSLVAFTLSDIFDLFQYFFPAYQKIWLDIIGTLSFLSVVPNGCLGLFLTLSLQRSRSRLDAIEKELKTKARKHHTHDKLCRLESKDSWPVLLIKKEHYQVNPQLLLDESGETSVAGFFGMTDAGVFVPEPCHFTTTSLRPVMDLFTTDQETASMPPPSESVIPHHIQERHGLKDARNENLQDTLPTGFIGLDTTRTCESFGIPPPPPPLMYRINS